MTNIITACFGGTRFTNTRPAWLIDHGMVLQIKGVELPDVYEVDFSNSKAETATRVLGNTDGVVIPDQYFLNNAKQIYAWVYLTTGDSGFTTLQITIPLAQRPDVSTEPPTPQETSLIEQAIAALNDGVARAETAAEDAEAAAANIQQTVDDALQAAKDSGEFDGTDGVNGVTFTPDVDAAGNISWTNDGGLPNPQTRNIKGPKGDKLTYADLTAADKADLVQGPIADAQTAAVNAVNNKGEEVLQSIPSDYTELSDDVDDLKSQISSVTDTLPAVYAFATKEPGTTTLPEGWSTTPGYLRGMNISNPGNLAGTTSSVSNTFYYLATEDMDVYVGSFAGNPGAVYIGTFSGAPYGTSYRVSPIYASNNSSYPLPTGETPLHVTAGQYVTFSLYNSQTLVNSAWTLYAIGTGETVLKSTLPLTEEMESQVDAKIGASVEEPLDTGYYHLSGEWKRNAWDSGGTTTDSRNYRVRYTETLTFDTDCYLLAEQGFYVVGYSSTDDFVTSTFLDARAVMSVYAGISYRIYIRRINEDTSEIADINTFSKALSVSTALAPIELYKPTFADVSMFERVGVCGDSYAAGGGIISGIRSLTWGKNLERQAGITVDIYAKSGQTVVQWVQDATNGLPALLAGTECGLYWLQHGINGTSTPEDLGTPADMSASPRPATFYGQYTEAVEQIKATFPNARIMLATIVGSSFSLYQTQYANVNAAIRAIAEYCEVMLVDVADDDFYRSPYYSWWSRSNHPTAMQCGGIAMANRRLISKCIQENGNYFVNYGVRS